MTALEARKLAEDDMKAGRPRNTPICVIGWKSSTASAS
mgnify:CR=1 FL=1